MEIGVGFLINLMLVLEWRGGDLYFDKQPWLLHAWLRPLLNNSQGGGDRMTSKGTHCQLCQSQPYSRQFVDNGERRDFDGCGYHTCKSHRGHSGFTFRSEKGSVSFLLVRELPTL